MLNKFIKEICNYKNQFKLLILFKFYLIQFSFFNCYLISFFYYLKHFISLQIKLYPLFPIIPLRKQLLID